MKPRILPVCLALFTLAALHPTDGAPFSARLPGVLHECETNTARVCGTWRASGGGYAAEWPQGSVADIKVLRFDRDTILMQRHDPAGSSRGMRAIYQGRPTGARSAGGIVTWSYQGLRFSGSWEAEW